MKKTDEYLTRDTWNIQPKREAPTNVVFNTEPAQAVSVPEGWKLVPDKKNPFVTEERIKQLMVETEIACMDKKGKFIAWPAFPTSIEGFLKFAQALLQEVETVEAHHFVFNPEEWMMVRKERVEELKRLANVKFENSYIGRGLYDEQTSRQNERLGESTLEEVRDVLSWFDEDLKYAAIACEVKQ